jgi:hypothetical protein
VIALTNTALLESIIAGRGLKKNYIAKMLDITPETLGRKIKNTAEFKASEIDKMCQILAIDDLEIRDAVFFAQE